MGNNKAIVFDLQRYSLHDGPGIRTIAFLKGCPLKCLWCCNPESQSRDIEVEFYADKCTGCGQCSKACQNDAIISDAKYIIDKEKCINCCKCSEICIAGAIRKIGKWMTADEVVREVKNDERFFRKSGGGITLSGGEPLIWKEFCKDVLMTCYNMNIHTAIETTGFVPTETLEEIMDYTDLFLYDIKSMDNERHKSLTGVSNELILHNLRFLREHDKNVIMRIPVIPGCNFIEEELEQMIDLADETGITEVNIMPYHNLGQDKYDRLGMEYELEGTECLKFADNLKEQIEKYNYLFRKHDNVNVIY